jgi:hypothetical protein
VGSRERKRAERHKRKARRAERREEKPAGADAGAAGTAAEVAAAAEIGAAAERDATPGTEGAMQRGYARAEQRNREAREALVPLGEGERPLVVTIGAVISSLLAASIVISYLAGAEVDGDRPNIVQIIVPTLLVGVMAWGMWRARYWAVLGFQTLMVILLLAAVFGLVAAETVPQAVGTALLIGVTGTFFYFMIKALARIQMPHRLPRE